MKKGHTSRSRKFRLKQKKAVRYLRQHSTVAECLLWKKLRNRNVKGLKFRRQHPIGEYIVDFFCHQLNLIIEIDGSIHDLFQGYDAQRQSCLESLGYRVVRFTNRDVLESIETIIETIAQLADIHSSRSHCAGPSDVKPPP